ncbi:hypothetical protein [Bartonella phoceensis]|uniref:hypothetical protein n=1 Tax=Bartonella phoceensis TaxID=270249 RepID=UPI0031B62916
MLLTSNLDAKAYSIKKPQANNTVEKNTFDLQNKRDQLNVTMTGHKKLVTAHRDFILPLNIFQDILVLNLSLVMTTVIYTQLGNPQTQYFLNKRAPPLV